MRSLRWVLFGVALAGAALIRYSWEPGELSARVGNAKDRRSAPDFALADASGATVRLSDYKGKVVCLTSGRLGAARARSRSPGSSNLRKPIAVVVLQCWESPWMTTVGRL